jgi:hypothetical protein
VLFQSVVILSSLLDSCLGDKKLAVFVAKLWNVYVLDASYGTKHPLSELPAGTVPRMCRLQWPDHGRSGQVVWFGQRHITLGVTV